MRSRATLWILVLLSISTTASGGVFLKAELAAEQEPFIIVHPIAYTGTGGNLQVSVCSSSPDTVPAIREAIRIWNELTPTTGNCHGCRVFEDPPLDPPLPSYDMPTTVLHELGHCAMGLGHTTWPAGSLGSSFTNSQSASSFNVGNDGIIGSRDDVPTPLPGTRLIHWFRASDNNPVTIDGTVLDSSTFTRRILDLPAGSTWPANANRYVSAALGHPETQAVMYGGTGRGVRYSGLSADDINTVKFGMSGLDAVAGNADDYTIELVFEPDCLAANVIVNFLPIDGQGGFLGQCDAEIEAVGSSPVQIHFRVVPGEAGQLVVNIDSEDDWKVLLVDDFETGDTSRWSDVFALTTTPND